MVGDCGYAYDKTLRWPDCTGHVFYNDSSCDIECMATEYLAEIMTISLGVNQPEAGKGIGFWDVVSKDDLIKKDPLGENLMKQILERLPNKTPNGNYRPGRNGYRMACIQLRQCKGGKAAGKLIEVKL